MEWWQERFAPSYLLYNCILEDDRLFLGEERIGADNPKVVEFGKVEGDGFDGPVESVVVGNRM